MTMTRAERGLAASTKDWEGAETDLYLSNVGGTGDGTNGGALGAAHLLLAEYAGGPYVYVLEHDEISYIYCQVP